MNATLTWERVAERFAAGVRRVCDKAELVWKSLRCRVRGLWGSTLALFGLDVDDPDKLEEERRQRVADALRARLGGDIVNRLCAASNIERVEILRTIAETTADALEIPSVAFRVGVLEPDIDGKFSYADRLVMVAVSKVECRPMGEEEAQALLDTVFHEVYHAFQHEAVGAPMKYGVCREQANIWDRNFTFYISPSQNRRLYQLQSVEVTARCFAHAVVVRWNKKGC